jgi:hypothetical protein
MSLGRTLSAFLFLLALVFAGVPSVFAESCSTAQEMDQATRTALGTAATQYFQYIAQNQPAQLAQNGVAEIANNVAGLTQLLEKDRDSLAGSTATPRNTYILDASEASQTLAQALFYCGVMNSPVKVGFTLQNLPPGKYGLVIMDVQNSKKPYFYSFLLRQEAGQWKLAGLFPHPREVLGHDAQWYWQQARNYRQKGENHNAWFYYLIARDLAAPVPFMGTHKLDNFQEEVQQAQPPDIPGQNPMTLTGANGKSYQVTNLFVVPDDKTNSLALVMKYQALTDINDTGTTFLENKEAMKALLARYPELREPFQNLVARAVAPSGQDFGSMLPMDQIK